MKKTLLSVLVVCGVSLGAYAQSIPTEWSTRYQTVMDSITSNFEGDGEPIGISMAVNVPGIGTWQGASGMAEPGVSMTTDMTTGVASNGKMFTAVILLKLQEANLLSLNDQIGQYITEDLHDIDKTATIRQLLMHETGFFDYSNDRVDAYYEDVLADLDRYWTIPEVVDRIEAPHFAVGTGHRYSNTNYILAAWVIEEVTNMSFTEALHQYITQPLGLNRTFEANESTALDGTPEASSYFGGIWYPRLGFTSFYSMDLGAGSTMSTPADMAAFYQAIFGAGTFLTAESRQQLLKFDAATQYGLAVWHSYSNALQREVYYHTGSNAGFLSEATYDPMTGASIFWITNNDQTNFTNNSVAIRREFRKGYPKQANDAGIDHIVSPRGTVCIGAITPIVVIKNYGSATLTSAAIKYQLNNNANIFTYNWTGSLATGETAQVTLTTIPINQNNNHTLKVWTENPNGSAEGYTFNDMKTANFAARTGGTGEFTSFTENFEGETSAIKVWNPKHISAHQWGVTKLSGSSGNHSLATSNEFSVVGDESVADLPLIALSGNNELTFKYANAYREGHENTLQVLVSDDCGATWDTLFNKTGIELSQGVESGEWLYYPQTDEEWNTETISLNEYAGASVQIRFKRIMDTAIGDNLFLDDIHVGSALGIAGRDKNIINVYPNPASDKVTIVGLPEGTPVALYTISGQKLLEVTANGDTVIDISGFAKGMYFLNTAKGSAKIIKK
jgi:CubicO group peptidase (beta-lactamase class C family)